MASCDDNNRLQSPFGLGGPPDRRKGLIPLSVIRRPATKQPRQGYMFYNPGTQALAQEFNIHAMLNQLGPSWNLISWDPRGVLKSGPNVTLFSTDREYADFWEQFQGPNQLEASGNLTTPSDVAFFVGTCAVTRDLVALVDAIYGTGADDGHCYIPNTNVSQPAVVEPYLYSNKVPIDGLETDKESSERAFIKWTEVCAANPDKCPLAARGNNTAEGVHKVVENALDVAYRNYDGTKWNPVLDFSDTTISSNPRRWTFNTIASQLYSGLYEPMFGSQISAAIEGIINEQSNINSTTAPSLKRGTQSIAPPSRMLPYSPLSPFANIYPDYVRNMVIFAIFCGDSIDHHGRTTKEVFQKIVKASQTVSRTFTPISVENSPRTMCHKWTSRDGRKDPITPYSSARTLASSKHLGNKARLVKYHTLGHGSVSACMDDAIRKYLNGTPPRDAGHDEADVECRPE
ncbi:13715_t:CDS:2, partial [Acaulospora colombiana]